MNASTDMAEHQVTFDSGTQTIQWRIYLGALAQRQNWIFLIGFVVVLFVLRLESAVLYLLAASLAAFALTAFQIKKRSRHPRNGVVTINETGVRAVSSEVDRTCHWSKVKKVVARAGDLFFITDADSIAVPREAFSDSNDAHEFHQAALALWEANRGIKKIHVGPNTHSKPKGAIPTESIPDAEQYLLDHDEEVWRELELEQKNQTDNKIV